MRDEGEEEQTEYDNISRLQLLLPPSWPKPPLPALPCIVLAIKLVSCFCPCLLLVFSQYDKVGHLKLKLDHFSSLLKSPQCVHLPQNKE